VLRSQCRLPSSLVLPLLSLLCVLSWVHNALDYALSVGFCGTYELGKAWPWLPSCRWLNVLMPESRIVYDDEAALKVGRCRLTVTNPELKARLVSGLATKMQ